MADGNRFLLEFLPWYHTKFQMDCAQVSDLHRSTQDAPTLDRIFCREECRIVRKDQTISYKRQIHDIPAFLLVSPFSLQELFTPKTLEKKILLPEDHPWKKAFLPQKKTGNIHSLIGKESP